ncbi:MAG TPA: DUF4157 domain-containing protein [Kofleriaceae bacterium]|nr:DUF4157 domain-containing protein [Kofleriaceae bacterium]
MRQQAIRPHRDEPGFLPLYRREWTRDRDRDLDDGRERPMPAPAAPGKRDMVSRVYRDAIGPAPSMPGPEAEAALNGAATTGGGHGLPSDLRAELEAALGVDLSGVRLHADGASAEAAQAIRARAYAVGDDIFFAAGAYEPTAADGKRLIAHEVAHTVQQKSTPGGARQEKLEVSQPGDAAEVEADRFADAFVSGGSIAPISATPSAAAHRHPDPKLEEIKKALEHVQGYSMVGLLPTLRELQPVEARSDHATAMLVGGPRLVLAQKAALHHGAWLEFINAHQALLAGLPYDQVGDIMAFLGGPRGGAYYSADQFGGLFDGLVDPATGTLTLYWRVKVDAEGATRFGGGAAGTPQGEEEKKAALDKFKAELPGAIETVWKANLRPSRPLGAVTALRCGVKVVIVESGQHKIMHVSPGQGRSGMSAEDPDGTVRQEINQPSTPEETPVADEHGHMSGAITVSQTVSAHEFGHAIGQNHPVCKEEHDRCYGLTAPQKGSIMGKGNTLTNNSNQKSIAKATSAAEKQKAIEAEKKHNDFQPFIKIAERWTRDAALPGELSKMVTWTAS